MAGRGRLSRTWSSSSGNFHATCLLPCDAAPERAALYGFAAALAVADTLDGYDLIVPAALKWPNDVLIDGAKIAGILVEREAEALLVGCGINLVSHPDDTPYPATHLTAVMDPDALAGPEPRFTGADAVLAVLAARLAHWSARLQGEGFAPLRRAWLARAHGLGRTVTVGGQIGTLRGLGPDGALLMVRPDGTEHRVHAGDVSFG